MGFRNLSIESRCKCSYGGGYLVVTKSDSTARVHFSEIASIVFSTTKVYVSAHLMAELARHEIPVVFCDEKSLPIAESLPLHGAYNSYAKVCTQLEWKLTVKKRVWQRIVRDKIAMQASVLRPRCHPDAAKVLDGYISDVKSGDSDNREAVAAGVYFPVLFGDGFNRDLDCPTNAALNYGYTIVLSKVAREVAASGYLTQVGIHHRSEVNPWNLACDLMEPFRPYVDKVVCGLDFVNLDTKVKHRLIDIMSDDVTYEDGKYKLASVVKYYVKDCLDVLETARPVSEIRCYSIP